jgi:hypothetical protein
MKQRQCKGDLPMTKSSARIKGARQRISLMLRTRSTALTLLWTLTLLMLMSSTPRISAQVLYGRLTGNITDPTGAQVPNAHVVATETATGVVHEADTNAQGTYLFTDLNPGSYKLLVTAQGFAASGMGGLSLQANSTIRADLTMKLGTTSEQITVSTAPPELKTEEADTSYNISQTQMQELPTTSSTGRNFQSLYRLVPGSTPPAEQNSAGSNPQRSQAVNVNGVSNATNTTRIDGAVDAYPWLAYLVAYLPPTDGIENIDVVTGSFNAEQGAAGGSAINVTIKSGTNQFHGSVWEYNSIKQFNALTWSNRTGVAPKNIYNEYGFSIGGPVKRNKLFFFFDYNKVPIRKAIGGTYVTVPTMAMRGGDFTATDVKIYDPASGTATGTGKTQFTGNIISSARISKAASTLLAKLPAPNAGAAGALTNNYTNTAVNSFERENYDTKINYTPTQMTSFFGHYSISPSDISDPQVFGFNPGGGTWDGGQPGHATGRIQNVGLGFTHGFTANFLMDANAGFTRQRLGANSDDFSLGDYGTSTLGIPGTNWSGSSYYAGIPGFYFTTYASLGNANSGSPFLFKDNQYTANANASWIHGKHAIRFGGEYLHAAINHIQPGSGSYSTPRGSFIFGGGATAASGATISYINSFADFLLGQATQYQKGVQSFNPEPLRYSTFAFYAQDTFQLTHDITLNYGVRYEYYPIPVGDHFGSVLYDPSIRSTVADSTYGTHTVGTVLVGGKGSTAQHAGISNGWGMIVPRFGISYRLDNKTVIRGGFGITTDPDTLRGLLQAYPAAVTTSVTGANSYVAATSLNTGLQSTTTQVGIPTLTLPDISSGSIALPSSISTVTIPKDFRRGYIQSDNISVQRELPLHLVASVAYVGTHAVRQQSSVNINASYPGGGTAGRLLNSTYGTGTNDSDINALQPFRGSRYHGLQTQLTRSSDIHGATGIIYTFSKAQNASDNSQASGLTFAYPTYWNRNWSLAGYDRKHNFQWWTIYNLPFGRDQKYFTSGPLAYIVGGWKLSTALSRVSGTPLTITGSNAFSAYGNTTVADRVAGVNMTLSGRNYSGSGFRYLNPAAFADVTSSTASTPRFGTAGRNCVRGPGYFDLDAGLKKTFPIWSSVRFEFAAESFNITNTPQFANPSTTVTSSTFGLITTSNSNRSLRLSGRISF